MRAVVGQVVHRRTAQCQRPDAIHGGQKQKIGQGFVHQYGRQNGSGGPVQQGQGMVPGVLVGPACLREGAEEMLQFGFHLGTGIWFRHFTVVYHKAGKNGNDTDRQFVPEGTGAFQRSKSVLQ